MEGDCSVGTVTKEEVILLEEQVSGNAAGF